MPDLLLELRSEEIPARMQRKAAGDLRRMVTDGLVEAGLTYEGCQEYWTPRRLALDLRGLTARSRDVREEKKGPGVNAPEQAIQGFLRSAGLSDIAQAHVHSDPKKGDFYVAHTLKPGRPAEAIVAELVPSVIRAFPWPKSMRWGKASAKPGALRWVRPLQSIVCTFGPETGEAVVIDFEVDGIRAGNVTFGHRFHAPDAITVRRFDDYVSKLEAAKVVLDAGRRKEIIAADAANLAFANGLELVADDALLEEVSGLVEWPVVLMGEFEADYLAIPPEVIRLTIRANQKCFVCTPTSPLRGSEGRARQAARPNDAEGAGGVAGDDSTLSNHFVLTANIDARDGGAEIVHGNGKVVRARLSDALYFWKTDQSDLPDLALLKPSAEKFSLDLKKPLDQRMARLDHLGVTFHAKLGTQGQRVQRIAELAAELAPIVGADPALARRAAVLAKADLTTEVVGEFPELQGAMGRKYALLQGEHPSVAAAIEEHYKPQGPSDRVPTDPVSVAVALADKLDTLVGFWAIDEKPTGSKDPFALRRAALGVIRIVVENRVRLGLIRMLMNPTLQYFFKFQGEGSVRYLEAAQMLEAVGLASAEFSREIKDRLIGQSAKEAFVEQTPEMAWRLETNLLAFFHDRLKVYLRDQGARHDLIDAVLASGGNAAALSPLEGEMAGRPEGVAAEGTTSRHSAADATPPRSAARIDPPLKGEGNAVSNSAKGRKPDRASAGQAAPAEASERSERSAVSESNSDLLAIVRRVEALGKLLDTEDGKDLLAGTKRAANILAAEEKKGTRIAASVDEALFTDPAEKALFAAVNQAESKAAQAIEAEDFSAAMVALSALRGPVDSFFEHVLVNDPEETVRANRLALLARIRSATGQVADFSKIAG